MRTEDIEAGGARPQISPQPIERLLMVADAAVAAVDELPAPVRAMID